MKSETRNFELLDFLRAKKIVGASPQKLLYYCIDRQYSSIPDRLRDPSHHP